MRMPAIARYLAALGATALLAAGASACSTSNSPSPGASQASSSTARPSTLTIATSFAIGDLDPIENGYWGNELGYGELLMRPQVGGTVTPWLLKSLTNTSATTWVLTLNSGIRFQDGKPLDAASLIACMQYQLRQNSSATAALPGAKLSATGADQVTLTTTSPVPDMPYILGDEDFFIIYDQAAYLKAKGSPAKLIAAKIYTGPFVVTDVSDQIMHEVRNPSYWDGTPTLPEVTVKFITDAQSRILAVEHGEADLALYPPTTAARTLTGRTDAYFDTGTPRGPTFLLFMNEHTAPFNDVNVRRAVQSAVNYDQLASQVMNGLYQPAIGMYAASQPYALTTQVTNVAKAEQLLTSDGWTSSSAGGVRHKDGKALAFTIDTYAEQPDTATLAVALQAELSAAGFDVSISQVPDIDAAQKNPAGWTSALEGDGTTSFAGDPITPLQEYWASKGPGNTTGVSNQKLDSLVNQLAVTLTTSGRDALLKQTQQIIGDNAYTIFVGQRLPAVIAGPAWRNYPVQAANLWVSATTAPTS
ncbi:MAG TPA: ABC transporter substrate-binding protein [Trebonia sp.]|jgi:peptide/nickel transport system substrate-binding protein|nr:ABC transporter substrate-binding protein [Trebonia sp.]